MHRRWPLSSGALVLTLTTALACSREPAVSDETYREAVAAFHTSLAALQTSQDVLARSELERLIQLVPEEPAGYANLGLLLLRQQQIDEGAQRLEKAVSLAPKNAAIERLLALAESQRGNLEQSIRHWRRAIDLDPADLKAPFALAREIERQGGPDSDAEALRLLEALVQRSGNLAARLEYARVAAKRGDAAALERALDGLSPGSASWPTVAQERLRAAQQAAARSPAEAVTPVTFLRNVLLPTPEYRLASAAVSTPQTSAGEPVMRLIAIQNPDPQPAAADEALAFSIAEETAGALPGAAWAGAVWLNGDARPAVITATGREARVGTGATLGFPGGASAVAPGPDGVVAADLNYDFRTDLILAGSAGLKIFRQDDKGGFADRTEAAKLPVNISGAALHGAWPADIDTDGDLDLVVAPMNGPSVVLRNNGDDSFTVRSFFTGVAHLRGFAWADLDGEGVPDAAFLDQDGTVRIYLNLRSAEFRESQVPPGLPRVAAIAAADATGDGILDVLGVTADGVVWRISQRNGSGLEAAELTRVEPPSGLAPGTARLLVADVDNNGAGDLIVAGPDASRIALGVPGGTFRPLESAPGLRVLSAADVNGDGRLDLVGSGNKGALIARSKGQKNYHWQAFRPRAATVPTGDQRVNSFGIGGEIEVRTGLHAQKQIIASPLVHFGLGDATQAEVARITWPNGVLQSEFDLRADNPIAASQRLKGSCPWLFAWNGREVAFVTDFIWRSPLGLRINAQATADVLMTEDWVKIRGDQLAAKDGAYDLRLTAELWETHFFDLVSLLVVDHPAGTEVFVDERFAVPPPRLGVIATSPVQAFRSVRDDSGREVHDVVRARDDRHLDFAGRGAYQGVTRDHFVELELPDEAPRSGPLWLVAQGWVHPTDSSINVALGQGTHAPPTGLSLHVADAAGRFREVRTGLGFPAGKDKTILIDLADVFAGSGPRRLRLKTNLEIFWDRLGWAVGQPPVQPQPVALASAELRYRGYSVTEQKDASTPERPRYVLEGTAPRWRDLEGFHTRFGDVRELLLKIEDRYMIMNAGDELLLKFPEAPPPAAGMVRDFVLVGDGWVKDGDFNTRASRTVLPLPTHRFPKYDAHPGLLQDDPVYRRYPDDFERYHTRYVWPGLVRDALRVRIDPDDR
jgi:tetratricopeptide (TPR) repeat protein